MSESPDTERPGRDMCYIFRLKSPDTCGGAKFWSQRNFPQKKYLHASAQLVSTNPFHNVHKHPNTHRATWSEHSSEYARNFFPNNTECLVIRRLLVDIVCLLW